MLASELPATCACRFQVKSEDVLLNGKVSVTSMNTSIKRSI